MIASSPLGDCSGQLSASFEAPRAKPKESTTLMEFHSDRPVWSGAANRSFGPDCNPGNLVRCEDPRPPACDESKLAFRDDDAPIRESGNTQGSEGDNREEGQEYDDRIVQDDCERSVVRHRSRDHTVCDQRHDVSQRGEVVNIESIFERRLFHVFE